MFSRRSFVFGTAGLAAGCYARPPKPLPYAATPEEELRERIGGRVRAFRGSALDSGVSVGVWQGGRPSVFGYGRTSLHDPHAPSADALFELGSLGEVLVCLLLGESVQRGRVTLDDPLRAHLPPSVTLPEGSAQAITLRQLGLNTSGLPAIADLEARAPDEPSLARLVQVARPETLPGARFQPSNLGMALLGQSLATRDGVPITALLTDRIARPLGMLSTTRFARTVALDESRLVEGADAIGQRRPPRFDVPLLGVAALRTSTNDLLRLTAALLAPPPGPLGAAIRECLATRRPLDDGSQVALGFRVEPTSGQLWQTGETAAFRAALLVDPAQGRALTLLVASAAIDARGLLFEIARELALPSSRSIRPTGHTVAALPPGSTPASVDLEGAVRFVGYHLETPVARAGDSVRVALYWQCVTPIADDLRVLVSGTDEHGRERLRADHYPAAGRYPSRQWRPGEIVADELVLRVPGGYDAGRLTLWLGLGAAGRVLRASPGARVDLQGRIRGPSLEITRK